MSVIRNKYNHITIIYIHTYIYIELPFDLDLYRIKHDAHRFLWRNYHVEYELNGGTEKKTDRPSNML